MKFYKLPQHLASDRDLPDSAKVLFSVIADRIGHHRSAWPGQRSLSQDAGQSRNTVSAGIDALEKAGWIIITRGEDGLCNHYHFGPATGSELEPPKLRNCARWLKTWGGSKLGHGWLRNCAGTGSETAP